MSRLGSGISVSNFGTGKARYFKFCMQIDHGKYCRNDDKLPKCGRGQNHVTIIYILGPAP